jgi:hypothetical protein
MSSDATRRVVNLPILSEREVQSSIVETADRDGLWGLVLPMVALMDAANRDAVAAIVASRDRATLERACEAALMGEHWDTLFDLASRMSAAKRAELGAIVRHTLAPHDPELAARLAARSAQLGLSNLSRAGVSASRARS